MSLIDEVKREMDARQLRRVALFGTRFAIESRLFGQLTDVEVVTPQPDEVDYIHATYLQLVSAGIGLESHRHGLGRLAHRLMERDRVQAVILAGTELALVFNETNADFPHVDAARLHLNAIAQRAMATSPEQDCPNVEYRSKPRAS